MFRVSLIPVLNNSNHFGRKVVYIARKISGTKFSKSDSFRTEVILIAERVSSDYVVR